MNPNTIKEGYLEDFPIPITSESTEIILSQMRKSICKIYMDNGVKGTGFFCQVAYPDKNHLAKFLITNNHIIDESHLGKNSKIDFTINNDKIRNKIIIGNRKVYTSKKYDTTIVELFEGENDIKDFMELDFDMDGEDFNNIYIKKSIYILQYPNNEKVSVSYGIIQSIDLANNYNIFHLCSTDKGSSGSPILNTSNNKIIGIHRGAASHQNYNKGTLLFYPLKEFLSQKLKIKNEIKPVKFVLENTMNDFVFQCSIGGQSLKRIKKEMEDSAKQQIEGYQLLKFIDNKLYGVLEGPPNTYFENGFFNFVIVYENGYPLGKFPKFYFLSKIFHPNVDEFGLVCEEMYSHPALVVDKIIITIQSMLDDPNIEEVLNESAAKLYKENIKEYENIVRKYTSEYANFETVQKELKKINCKMELNN